MRVLVTGAGGWTAAAILLALAEAGHTLVGFDVSDPMRNSPAHQLLSRGFASDIGTLDEVRHAARGVDAIVHLAIAVDQESYRSPDLPFATNVRGTYNVFEAARCESVGKVVLMSEAAVHIDLQSGEKLDARTDWRSSTDADHLYDLTKRLQEEIARDYSETFGMPVVVLRAGHIVDGKEGVDANGQPLREISYCRGGWVCRYDLARACVKAVELAMPGFTAFHVIGSVPARAHFDIDRTELELRMVCDQQFVDFT
jgi:nucleoside-diphosphate-sugar epimerase